MKKTQHIVLNHDGFQMPDSPAEEQYGNLFDGEDDESEESDHHHKKGFA